jgi:hypothetical protein
LASSKKTSSRGGRKSTRAKKAAPKTAAAKAKAAAAKAAEATGLDDLTDGAAFEDAREELSDTAEAAKDAVTDKVDAAKDAVEDAEIVDASTDDITQSASDATDKAWEAVDETAKDASDFVSETASDAVEDIKDTAEPVQAEPAAIAAQPAAKSGGFMGMLTGGILAAVLGFGFAKYSETQGWFNFGAGGGADGSVQATIDAQTGEIDALKAQIEEISGLNTGLQTQLEAAVASAAEAQAQDAEAIAALREEFAALPSVTVDPEAMSDELRKTIDAQKEEMAALKAELAEIAGQKEEMAALQGELDKMAAFAQTQIAEAEAEVQTAAEAEAKAAEAEARAQARGALNVVRTSLADGAPFEAELAQVAAAVDVPEALQAVAADGVASENDLETGFETAARQALSASIKETTSDAPTDKLKSFFRNQLGTRSLAPREGDDPDAVLSRAQAAVKSGDIAAAVTELGQLPPTGQDAMSDWIQSAETRASALAAFEELSTALNEN